MSVEPILDWTFPQIIEKIGDYVEYIIFGKLNYFKTKYIKNWELVAYRIMEICEEHGLKYYIKPPLKDYIKERRKLKNLFKKFFT